MYTAYTVAIIVVSLFPISHFTSTTIETTTESTTTTRPTVTTRWTTKTYDELFPLLSKSRPCDQCPLVFFPVCSNQNQTYLNMCFFACKNVTKNKEKIIDRVNRPEEKTVDSLRNMHIVYAITIIVAIFPPFYHQQKTVSYDRLVPPLSKSRPCKDCPLVYLPVCSSKNITYMNYCFFACKNITEKKEKIVYRKTCIFF